ncbi:MAG: helix-turn-helix domain-containing protein [Planctomycetes bacterium]|jgi:AraC-like DNA-binding protein|nr:helix-turn-helix domain-containing protein [Planctomycetota bacterium]
MDLPLYRDPAEGVLWRVTGFGQEHHAPGRPYHWANADRQPAGQCVAQLTRAGRAAIDTPAGRHVAGPGQFLLFRFGEPTAYGKLDRDDDYACRWVNLEGAGLTEHFDAFRARHGYVVGLESPAAGEEQLAQLTALADPAAGTSRTTMAQAVHAFLLRLFEQAEHGRRQSLSPAEQAVAAILDNPYRPWSLKRVAADFGVSREHLTRVFTDKVGRSPHRHLSAVRLQRGLRLLRETHLPLGQVAEQSGFESAHNLARHVRRATGQSPTALRADHTALV